jgi:hypothetical protein
VSQSFKTLSQALATLRPMSRSVLIAHTPRADEAAWVESDQTLRAAANECTRAAPRDNAALAHRPARATPTARGGLPARTALWFWAEPSALE